MEFADVKRLLAEKYPDLSIVPISHDAFVFEERVKQKCFHCKNYNSKWTCPPRIPKLDWPKLLREYEHAAIVYCSIPVDDKNFEEQRIASTNRVHRALLYLEGELYKHNNSLANSFIGGSCKLCRNNCNKERCVNPYLSRIPLEATGCNVIKTLASVGIDIVFPVADRLHRYGLFLW